MQPIIPDDAQRQAIEQGAMAGIHLCWTCGTCDSECTISLSTGRLRPRVMVRMANLGMVGELMASPQIWYCLDCRRCGLGCPNRVKPFGLMSYLRAEAIRTGRIDPAVTTARHRLVGQFQRVRYRAILRAMRSERIEVAEREWYQWLEKPLGVTAFDEIELGAKSDSVSLRLPDGHTFQACLSCGECSNCCPVCYERATFDPQSVIRMVNLGLAEKLLKSPALWMCLGCRHCTQACSQLVCGHEVIRRLRLLAVEKGCVDPCFPSRLLQLDRLIYPRLLDEIDHLTGMFGLKSNINAVPRLPLSQREISLY